MTKINWTDANAKLKWIKKDHKELNRVSPVKDCTTCWLIKLIEELRKGI